VLMTDGSKEFLASSERPRSVFGAVLTSYIKAKSSTRRWRLCLLLTLLIASATSNDPTGLWVVVGPDSKRKKKNGVQSPDAQCLPTLCEAPGATTTYQQQLRSTDLHCKLSPGRQSTKTFSWNARNGWGGDQLIIGIDIMKTLPLDTAEFFQTLVCARPYLISIIEPSCYP
jgi:hypothetical protein